MLLLWLLRFCFYAFRCFSILLFVDFKQIDLFIYFDPTLFYSFIVVL